MSENKCPCCGDSISIFPDSGFWECDSCPFMCALEDLPRIVAAMNAEARHNALVEAWRQRKRADRLERAMASVLEVTEGHVGSGPLNVIASIAVNVLEGQYDD